MGNFTITKPIPKPNQITLPACDVTNLREPLYGHTIDLGSNYLTNNYLTITGNFDRSIERRPQRFFPFDGNFNDTLLARYTIKTNLCTLTLNKLSYKMAGFGTDFVINNVRASAGNVTFSSNTSKLCSVFPPNSDRNYYTGYTTLTSNGPLTIGPNSIITIDVRGSIRFAQYDENRSSAIRGTLRPWFGDVDPGSPDLGIISDSLSFGEQVNYTSNGLNIQRECTR